LTKPLPNSDAESAELSAELDSAELRAKMLLYSPAQRFITTQEELAAREASIVEADLVVKELSERLEEARDGQATRAMKRGPKAPSPREETLLKKIGQRIRQARILKGLSREELRLRAGLGRGDTIWRIEHGQNNVTVSMLVQLADAIGVPASDLLTDTPERHQEPSPPPTPLIAAQETIGALVLASPARDEILRILVRGSQE
jgi:transcriptional regulator with XRE-family HTH domain